MPDVYSCRRKRKRKRKRRLCKSRPVKKIIVHQLSQPNRDPLFIETL
jgi:hypothetical protein